MKPPGVLPGTRSRLIAGPAGIVRIKNAPDTWSRAGVAWKGFISTESRRWKGGNDMNCLKCEHCKKARFQTAYIDQLWTYCQHPDILAANGRRERVKSIFRARGPVWCPLKVKAK